MDKINQIEHNPSLKHTTGSFNRMSGYLKDRQGSSLVAVLIVITILFTLIGAVMLAVIQQGRFIQGDINQLKARYAAEAGIYHFLADSTSPLVTGNDSLRVTLTDSSIVTIASQPFGGFLSITSSAEIRGQKKTIHTLAGEQPPNVFDRAVVLGDIRSKLNITGSTKITGDIEVGPLGIQYSPFKGELFSGSVKGDTIKSTRSPLPDFDEAFYNTEIEQCEKLLEEPPDQALLLENERFDPAAVTIENHDVLYKEGNLIIETDPEFSFPGQITIIVTDTLWIEGTLEFAELSRLIAGQHLALSGQAKGRHILAYSGRDIITEGSVEMAVQLIAREHIIIKIGRAHV